MSMVRYKKNDIPPMTAERLAELRALSEMPDDTIDYSDIPELTDLFWAKAVRNPFYKPVKEGVTLRLDADVLQWLKSQGKGYQTRINAMLRREMLREVSQHHGA